MINEFINDINTFSSHWFSFCQHTYAYIFLIFLVVYTGISAAVTSNPKFFKGIIVSAFSTLFVYLTIPILLVILIPFSILAITLVGVGIMWW